LQLQIDVSEEALVKVDMQEMADYTEEYSPSTMRDAGYFIMMEDTSPLPRGCQNDLLEITAKNDRAVVSLLGDAVLAMRRKRKASIEVIMYQESWEDENYDEPMRLFEKAMKGKCEVA
jgi:hypothetical protein